MTRSGCRWKSGMVIVTLVSTGCASAARSERGGPSIVQYDVWVTSESVDEVSRIRFDGDTAVVVSRRSVGRLPTEIEGPHGIAVTPDGRYIVVALAHGTPNGTLLRIDTETDRVVGWVELARFPATVSVTPDGQYAFVSNFNLHGDHLPSSISMVHLPTMSEVTRTSTCVMPHGSRVSPEGARHYSVCMMDELLVELDATTGSLRRIFSVQRGREGSASLDREPTRRVDSHQAGCSPTWAEPSADGRSVFVTCNVAGEVLEIDVAEWRVTRRFTTGESPYNLGVSPDGRYLLVSLRNRIDPALEVFDLGSGEMVGRVPVTTTLAHGIAVTPDSRYAFVTVEGVASEPGKVDVVDLRSMRRVTSVAVGQQATGVALVPSTVSAPETAVAVP